jgi:hypothetical protein
MTELLVELAGQPVALRKCSWVFRGPCGCAYGVSIAQTDHRVRAATAEQAWEMFEPNRVQRERDQAAGDTVEVMLTGDAVAALQLACPHDPKYGHPITPLPDGYVWAASDGWRARPRFKHLVAVSEPRDPRDVHRLFPYDHGKVPALCERSQTRDWSDAQWIVDDLPECSACQRAAQQLAVAA